MGTASRAKESFIGNDRQIEGRTPFASSRPHAAAPAHGRQPEGPRSGYGHAKPANLMQCMPSDSDMTVLLTQMRETANNCSTSIWHHRYTAILT